MSSSPVCQTGCGRRRGCSIPPAGYTPLDSSTPRGTLLALREDVGRHNAVDKAIGWAFLEELLPLNSTILMISGRGSFEIVQKAVAAGIPIVCAVSAPSSLAVDLARRFDQTLIGFLRGSRFNIYSSANRIELELIDPLAFEDS